jgi:hypothetical protein
MEFFLGASVFGAGVVVFVLTILRYFKPQALQRIPLGPFLNEWLTFFIIRIYLHSGVSLVLHQSHTLSKCTSPFFLLRT